MTTLREAAQQALEARVPEHTLPPLPEMAGLVGRYLANEGHSKWFFLPERQAWEWERSEEAVARGAESTEAVYTADQMRAYARAATRRAIVRAAAEIGRIME